VELLLMAKRKDSGGKRPVKPLPKKVTQKVRQERWLQQEDADA